RDHLTPEAWRALAALEQPAPIAQHLVNLSALSGVIHESVLHDRGWSLLMLGRRSVRARFLLQTFTLTVERLGRGRPIPASAAGVADFLRLHDSLLTFRRRNQCRAALPSLIELLLLSRANPRSLTYCLQQVSGILEELPSHTAPDAAPRD